MLTLASLAGVLLPALPGVGAAQSAGVKTGATLQHVQPTSARQTRDLNYYLTQDNFYEWTNPVGLAAIGSSEAEEGSFAFGSSVGDPNSYYDDFIAYVKGTTPIIYIDGYGGPEFSIGGANGILDVQPYVDINTQSAGYTWHTDDAQYKISVVFRMWLVRDVLKYEYKITNQSNAAVRMGFRTMHFLTWGYDYLAIPPTQITAGPYYIPGSTEQSVIRHYKDDKVPTKWFIRQEAFSEVNPPPLRFSQPLTSQDGVTRPSHLIFAPTDILLDYGWAQILEEALPENANVPSVIKDGTTYGLGDEMGVGLYYPIEALPYAQTRTIKGEFRLDWSTVKTLDKQYALAVNAPEYLDYIPGYSPSDIGYLSPSLFTVDGYLYSATRLMNPSASISITPGKGLVLDPPVQAQPVRTIEGVLEDYPYHWTLRADGTASGVIPITVTAYLNPGGAITTTRYINVPAMPAVASVHLQRASHFTGFPFTFANADAMTALAQVNTAIGPGFELAWWDPTLPGYRYARPNSYLDKLQLEAGRGYWLKVPPTAPNLTTGIPLVGAEPVNQRRSLTIRLERGWNAISNPYQYSIVWGYCSVVYQNEQYSIAEAIRIGLIRREMWIWDATTQEYAPPTNPFPWESMYGELKPTQAYWLYVTEGLYLVYTPNQFLPPMGGRALTETKKIRTPGSETQWQFELLVSTSQGKARGTLGVSPTDRDDLSDGDIMAPPIGPSGLAAYFPRRAWGRWSADYAADIQAPGAEKTWQLEVQCEQPNEQVVLRWPDLTQLPARMPLVLTDELTGRRVAMRTAPSYTFNSGQGGVRRFTITAGGVYQSLRITSTRVRQTTRNAGIVIECGVNIPARVTLRIRNASGRLVRTLGPTEVTGQGTINWDGRDEQDRILPAGIYVGELHAETVDEQRIRAIVTINTRN